RRRRCCGPRCCCRRRGGGLDAADAGVGIAVSALNLAVGLYVSAPTEVIAPPDFPELALTLADCLGQPNRAYLPPETRRVLSDPGVPLLITEGEKKAAKADQEGFQCV